jgi:hypothetical protein
MNWHEGKWAKLTPSTKLLSKAFPQAEPYGGRRGRRRGLMRKMSQRFVTQLLKPSFFGSLALSARHSARRLRTTDDAGFIT